MCWYQSPLKSSSTLGVYHCNNTPLGTTYVSRAKNNNSMHTWGFLRRMARWTENKGKKTDPSMMGMRRVTKRAKINGRCWNAITAGGKHKSRTTNATFWEFSIVKSVWLNIFWGLLLWQNWCDGQRRCHRNFRKTQDSKGLLGALFWYR